MKTKHILKTVGLISALSFSSLTLISCDSNDSSSSAIEEEQSSTFSLQVGDTVRVEVDGEFIPFRVISQNTINVDDSDIDIDFTQSSLSETTLQVDLDVNVATNIERLNTDLSNPNSVIRQVMRGEVTFPESANGVPNQVSHYLDEEYNLPVSANFDTESPSGSNTGYHLELGGLLTLDSSTEMFQWVFRDVEILTSDDSDFTAEFGAETVTNISGAYTLDRR